MTIFIYQAGNGAYVWSLNGTATKWFRLSPNTEVSVTGFPLGLRRLNTVTEYTQFVGRIEQALEWTQDRTIRFNLQQALNAAKPITLRNICA